MIDHFVKHDPTPRFILEQQEHELREIRQEMMEIGDLFEQNIDNPGVKRARTKNIESYLKVSQQHRMVFNELVECRRRAMGES
jgi:hypothetical protein